MWGSVCGGGSSRAMCSSRVMCIYSTSGKGISRMSVGRVVLRSVVILLPGLRFSRRAGTFVIRCVIIIVQC